MTADLERNGGMPVSRVAAVLSAVLGGGSLLALGWFLWAGSTQLVGLGLSPTMVLIWDAALSVTFFVQHSGMIRRPFRRRMARVVPLHLDGAVYSMASGGVLAAVLVAWQRSPVEVYSLSGPWWWLARAGFVAAVAGFAAGIRALHGFDGFGLRTIRDRLRGGTRQPAPLSVEGPYRWVRHPLYSCVLVMIWSCPEVTADRLLFNLLWSAWIVVGAVLEERDLVEDFGDRFLEYRAAVPMLVPWRLRPTWPAEE